MSDSYVTRCLINARQGDSGALFTLTDDGVLARLKGYAVVPLEDYRDLQKEAGKDVSDLDRLLALAQGEAA